MIRRVRRYVRRDDVLGDIAVGGRQVPAILCDDALDRPCLSKLLDLGAAEPWIPESAGVVPERQLHHAIGADVGKGIDQDAIDDAEDRAGGADPERQREDGRQGKPGPAAQFTRRVAAIADQCGHVMGLDGTGARRVGEVSPTTDGQPWRTLGYFGTQLVASRSLRFEILSERAAIFPIEPKSGVSQGGGSRGSPDPNRLGHQVEELAVRDGRIVDHVVDPVLSKTDVELRL